jgi:hypothetical protein
LNTQDNRVLARALKYNVSTEFSRTAPTGSMMGSGDNERYEPSEVAVIGEHSEMTGERNEHLDERWAEPSNKAQVGNVSTTGRYIHKFDPIGHIVTNESDLDEDPAAKKTHNVSASEMQSSSNVSMGMIRTADAICRKLLPWQAVCCPCAVEMFRDIRLQSLASQHEAFIVRMTQQLENKVLEFIQRKDDEVDRWLQKECVSKISTYMFGLEILSSRFLFVNFLTQSGFLGKSVACG